MSFQKRVIFWNKTGFWIAQKRLERATWPCPNTEVSVREIMNELKCAIQSTQNFSGLRCKNLCSPFPFQFIVLEAFIHFIRYIVIQRLMKPSLCCRRMNLAIQILAIWKMKGYNKSAVMVVENEIIIKQRRKNKTYFLDYRKFFSRPEQNLQSFLTSRCLFFS